MTDPFTTRRLVTNSPPGAHRPDLPRMSGTSAPPDCMCGRRRRRRRASCVVRQRLAGIGFAECHANAFDVEAKRRPWSVAEPHAAQFACAGVDPAPTHTEDTR